MRAAHYLLAVAIASGLPATAMAQTNPPATTTAAQTNYSAQTNNQWFASGFIGSNFSASNDRTPNINIDNNSSNSSLEFGGSIGYTWNRMFGAEFLADFTPTFSFDRVFNVASLGIVDDPHVNTYMLNAIAAVPIGEGRVQPYVSGGLGGVSVGADVLDNLLDLNGSTTRTNVTRLGTNIGGGVFGFAGNVGFRADVRYTHSSTEDRTGTLIADRLRENLLSGLHFWRANVGIAFRW